MAGDEPGGGRLPAKDVNDILAVEIACVAQEGLFALVVVFRVEDKGRGVASVRLRGHAIGERPAGESPGALFDIIFGVIEFPIHAHTQRKQLQQFPSVVLVDRVFMAKTVVQEIDHGRVLGNLDQQIPEATHAAPAEHLPLSMGCDLTLILAVGVA